MSFVLRICLISLTRAGHPLQGMCHHPHHHHQVTKSSSWSLIGGVVKFSSKQTTRARELVRNKILYFSNPTTGLRHHFVVVDLFFLCRRYVTEYSRHQTRTHKKCKEFLLSWIVSDKEVRKMMTTRRVSVKYLFVTMHTNKSP